MSHAFRSGDQPERRDESLVNAEIGRGLPRARQIDQLAGARYGEDRRKEQPGEEEDRIH